CHLYPIIRRRPLLDLARFMSLLSWPALGRTGSAFNPANFGPFLSLLLVLVPFWMSLCYSNSLAIQNLGLKPCLQIVALFFSLISQRARKKRILFYTVDNLCLHVFHFFAR